MSAQTMHPLRRFFSPARLMGWAVLAVVIILYVLPIVMLIVGAFRDAAPGQPGSWTLDGFRTAFSDPRTWTSLGNSLWLALMMGLIGTGIAAVMAAIAASPMRAGRWVTPVMVIALGMPPLFFAMSWDVLLSPRLGIMNGFFWSAFGWEGITLGGGAATAVIGGMKVSTLVYFLLLGPFRSMDRRQEEAAQVGGAGRLRVALTVTLPALLPALLAGFSIAFIIGVTAFDIPLIIGLPDGFNVFSTQIYAALNESSPPNYASASALAMVLIAIVISLVVARWLILDRRSFTTVGGKAAGYAPHPDRTTRILAIIAFVIFAFFVLVLPATQMVLSSLQPIFGAGTLSTANYTRVLQDPQLRTSLSNTAFVSIVGGAVAVGVAFTLALIGRYGSVAMRRMLDLATWLPWAANGVLLGLGLVWTFITIAPLRGLFGTIWIVLIGLVVATTPLAGRAIDGALAQISRELEESGRVFGGGVVRVAIGVVLRLMLPAVLAGWFISAINIVGNLEVPILLSLPTNRVLAVSIYQYWGNGQGTTAAAVFCLVTGIGILIAAVGAGLMWIGGRLLSAQRRSRAQHALEHTTVATPAAGELVGADAGVGGQER